MTHIAQFAQFILENHFNEYVNNLIKFSEKSDNELFNEINKAPVVERNKMFNDSSSDYLTSLVNNTFAESQRKRIDAFLSQHRHALAVYLNPSAIVRAYSMRKRILMELLLKFTKDAEVILMIGSEIDTQHAFAEEYIYKCFTDKEKEKEAVTMENERKLKEAQSIAHIGSWEWSIADNKLEWSTEMYNISGIDPKKVVPDYQLYMSIIHPDDRALMQHEIEDILRTRIPFNVQHRVVLPDGMVKTLNCRGRLMVAEDGTLVKLLGTAQDITKRILAEQNEALLKDLSMKQALIESEFKYRKIVEEAQDGIYTCDARGCFTYVNHGGEKICGYSEKELIGKHFTSIVSPEWINVVKDFYKEQFIDNKLETRYEFKCVTKSGEERWVEQTVIMLKTDNWITGFHCIVRDISTRKNAEIELMISQKQLTDAQKIAKIGNWEYDIYSKSFSCSDNLLTLYGLPFDTERNNIDTFKEYIHPEELATALETVKHSMNHKGGFTFTVNVTKPDGEKIMLRTRGETVYNVYGKPEKLIGIQQDITKEVATEHELRKLSLIASKTDNVVIVTDSDGRIEWVNEGFTNQTGYVLKDVVGTSGDILRHGEPTGLSPSSDSYKELLRKRQKVEYECMNYTKSGEPFWAITTLTPFFDSNGEIERIIAIDTNITNKKKAEQELIKAKELAEQTARHKERFMADMSHSIRTPLNGIIGFIRLMGETPLNHEQQEYQRIIKNSCDSLLSGLSLKAALPMIGRGFSMLGTNCAASGN